MTRFIVTFHENSDTGIAEEFGAEVIKELGSLRRLLVIEATVDIAQKLGEHPSVKFIEPDQLEPPVALQFISQSESHFVGNLKAREYWTRGIRGQGIKVAVMDSGIGKHNDLVIAGGINGYDTRTPYNVDVDGHGTHVGGIIGARMNLKGGFVGIAPECELYSIKADDNIDSGIYISAQIEGFNWAIANGINIINCSFGGPYPNAAREEALRAAHRAGILIVAANGNEGVNDPNRNNIGYPALLPETVGVANITFDNERIWHSSTGPTTEIAGYGTNIISTSNDGKGYIALTGTSMSSPLIAGLAALVWQMFPNETNEQIRKRLHSMCTNLGSQREYGHGVPDNPPTELFEKKKIFNMPAIARTTDKEKNLWSVRSVQNSNGMVVPHAKDTMINYIETT